MNIATIKDSPRAAERFQREGPGRLGIRAIETDCPDRCCGDAGPEGRCPHGYLTATATLAAQGRATITCPACGSGNVRRATAYFQCRTCDNEFQAA